MIGYDSTEPLGSSGARILHNHDGRQLLELPVEEVRELFKSAGVVMFRGFGADPWMMKAFADRFALRFNRDRLRPPVEGSDGLVQAVTEGMGYIEPHSEQANSPFRPDALWFCCETPTAEGGETLYWDGVRLWQQLTPSLRTLFGSKKLRFFQRYDRDKWQLFLGPGSTLDDVRRTLDPVEGVSYHVTPDDAIYLEYVCPAVVKTRYGGAAAFANSLLSEQKNTLGQLMTFDDGTPIPQSVVDEVREAMVPLTEEIVWQPGDLAFIDNSRFLHGRNAFTDTRRRIFSCLSFLNF